MRLLVAIAAAVVALIAVPDADAKVRCGSGTTAFAEGRLRIFGVFFRTPDESGSLHYACLGHRRRPLLVGGRGTSTGLASGDTPAYAVGGGGRYVAAYETSDGEGGPSASITVHDLRTRRAVAFVNLACCGTVPAFHVADDGTLLLLAADEGVLLKRSGERARVLSTPDAVPRDLAVSAGTAYWTEGSQPRAAALPGSWSGRMLEPVRLRRRRDACAGARGRTVAASGSVRVVDRGERRFACRIGRRGRFDVGAPGDSPPVILGDRWLFDTGEGSARMYDSVSRRRVFAHEDDVAQSAVTRDGTMAWLDFSARLLAQRPGEPPVELAPASAGAGPPAAGRRVVYWTRNGQLRRYRP